MSGLPSYDGLGAPEEIRTGAPEGIGAPPHGGWRGYYLTAYGIAVKHGFRGSEEEWLKTLTGERGERAELRFNGENKRFEYRYESEGEWRTLCELKDIQGDMVTAVLEEARGYALLAEEHEKGAERHEAASERYTAEAESWAHGETGVRKGEDEDNGKYYARVAAARAADAEDSAVRAETAAETAAEDASRHAVEDAAELLSGYVSDAENARSGAESAEAAARSSEEQAAASAEAAQSSAVASENSAKNSAESENAADAARRSAEAARDAAEAADEKAQLERLDAELAREGAETAAKDSAAARDAAAASAEASERAAVRAEEIVGQDFATKEYVADAVSAHDASPEAHADIRAELEKKADEESVASRLADKADKKGTEDALAEKAGKDELEAAKTAAATALSAHDASGEAHADIRESLALKADDAETKTALAGKVDVEDYKAAMKNKADLVEGKVKAEQLPEMDYDPAGSADAVDAKLSAHTGNLENPHKVTAAQVKARPDTWTPTAADVGAAPVERTVNGHALSEDVTLGADDVNAVPTTRKVNGKALAEDVTIGAGDIAFEDGETFQQKLDRGELRGQDGKPGADGTGGTPGKDGVSPTVKVSKADGVTTVEITDASGKQTATINDGAPGAKGDPGPNTVSTTTATDINGLLKGNGTNVLQAVEGTDFVPPTRTINGKALAEDITLSAAETGAVPASGGTFTGDVKFLYPHALRVRHVDGASIIDGGDEDADLYLQHHTPTKSIKLGNAGHQIYNNGAQYSGNAATATNASEHIANYGNPHGVTAAQTGALPTAGGTMSGVIAMGGNKVTNLATPTADNDAATKGYVDSKVSATDIQYYAMGLTAGNTNTNYFRIKKANTREGGNGGSSFEVSQNAVVTGYYYNYREFSCPVMLYASSSNMQVKAKQYGYSITYLYNGQITTKKVTSANYTEPLETLNGGETMTVLAVY